MARIYRFRKGRLRRKSNRLKGVLRGVFLAVCGVIAADQLLDGRVTWPQLAFKKAQSAYDGAAEWLSKSPAFIDPRHSDAPSAVRPADKSATVAEPAAEPSPPVFDVDFLARVTRVIDGDTIEVRNAERGNIRIRFHGIDTPERNQPYGRAATRELKRILTRAAVGVKVKDTDRYGRTVATIYQGDVNVNVEMVKRGYAWWYRRYARFDGDLRGAEAEAKGKRRGLWQDDNPVPPWEWRRR